ncbi:serine O-acetyltransferase [Buchnera aphidicola str. APS (Acyrthosiphon pisum)]|uniref:Serine acetyltransferase n=2 Tax=Buchnera aphidicola TaxID=9 RepID=CYSE_BUCAI|nr:serine O-acetyltransferase [Buchnera aphidicola]P57162.1 RecName: Full=Serine acetyltransferase; Short=SAT [Buchnera aphidicola str. APS (Acyrthosiphon pisum)]pir/A84936/ serine O-acetyltransferase (EC 2.3.1.30) [imported] - Buchnera sp. (strain APS) [Buchnera sp. (in: enterobacteria)]ADP66454.1 serine acetyltransferase [Buchnera aphidicola str. TLW03 (Acyrthosiphon pisum)]ADP67613.1 serine acetyltransferase [Buchnera aphidicola str. JF98 (Acyrthosiphon pisum)]OQX98959.1 MAG: serine acetylt
MCILKISRIWNKILYDVSFLLKKEPILSDFYQSSILQHQSFTSSLSYILSNKLSTSMISEKKIQGIFDDVYLNDRSILNFIVQDIKAVLKRDPAVNDYLTPLLYLKGFHALEAYRISHYLWNTGKKSLSLYLQSRISSEFSVDIHPAAFIGSGVMLDHATGIVIGEGVTIENDVSILHSVTLGGTGKNFSQNRHPTIRKGVVIGAGAKILGNIEVGSGAKIGAGSIVLKNVPSDVTVVGVPAKIVSQVSSKKYYSQKKKNSLKYINIFQHGDGI